MSCSLPPGSPVFSPSPSPAPHHSSRASDHHSSTSSPSTYSPCTAFSHNPLLKRRCRPPPLLVPAAAVSLATAAPHGMDVVAEQGDGFAAYCRRGKGRKRLVMEDRHVAAIGLEGDPRAALFGVFDGHGGNCAAEFAADNMPRIMAEELRKAQGGGPLRAAVALVEDAVRRAYLRTDHEFSSSRENQGGGACCVTALLREGRLVVSGAGDCRAVLSRGGKAEALTDDHRASRHDERDRIETQGGLVLNCRGTWRVQGSLAVSRGIGDTHLKPWVVAEPDTTTVAVDADCDLLILASDGLWDKVANQEAVDAARVTATASGQLPAACRRLAEMAASRGSTDDISVVIIQLHRLLP